MSAVLLLIGGFVLLYFGAEGLVRGSSSLAMRIGISPLIVGITVVAFGTSSPELIVSVGAALEGNPGIALGNVIGSNICNIALILGLAALIKPIKVHTQLIRTDVPVMIGASVLLWVMFSDQAINRLEGGILFIVLIGYLAYSIRKTRSRPEKVNGEMPPSGEMKPWRSVFFAVIGLILLAVGADMFVSGAIQVAQWFQIPDAVVGLTIVAVGTSLPELATSIVAAMKGEGDISIGNVIGSNIFNLLSILGITAMIAPMKSADISIIDLSVMLGLALLMLPLMRSGQTISRVEGVLLLAIYLGYITYLLWGTIQF